MPEDYTPPATPPADPPVIPLGVLRKQIENLCRQQDEALANYHRCGGSITVLQQIVSHGENLLHDAKLTKDLEAAEANPPVETPPEKPVE